MPATDLSGNSFENPQHSLRESSLKANRVPAIDKICKAAISAGASDIHLTVGKPPMFRLQGSFKGVDTSVTTEEIAKAYFDSISPDYAKLELNETGQVDFAFSLDIPEESIRRSFRVNAVKSLHGISTTMRLISDKIPEPQQIGLSNRILEKVSHETGLFLATGATGSGKSTTLASLIQWLANKGGLKIVTVEQPIEYQFNHGNSVVVQREVPNHARNFSATLNSMLRQDPDVIMVGELRDLEEIRVALRAAESGHLVLSTVHTNSAAESVNRIVDVFPGEEQELIKIMLSQCLLGVISQDLIPRQDEPGRILCYEVMFNNPAISNLIRKGQSERIDSALQTSLKDGMFTFDHMLERLLRDGKVSPKEALHFARNKQEIAGKIKSLRSHEE